MAASRDDAVDSAARGTRPTRLAALLLACRRAVGTPARRWLAAGTLGLGLVSAVLVTIGTPPAERSFAAVSGPVQSLMLTLVRMGTQEDHGASGSGEEAEMGSGHEHGGNRKGGQGLFRLVWLGLVVAAVVQELRKPSEERTWHGTVAGFVPYDFRVPTVSRFRSRMWAPDDAHLLTPHPFGVGWTINAGRAVALVRQRLPGAE